MTKFEELLEKYSKTAEDIDFDYEGMSDEELEQKFAELFDTAEGDPSGEGDPEDEDNGNGEGEPENDPEPEDETKEFSVSSTVEFAGRTLEFSRSLNDTIGALTELVNITYSETDNDYYDVDVYGDDKYVIMKGWWTGNAYKQSYKVKKDVYTLTGDRCVVRCQYLTEEEIAELDNMRANYSALSDKVSAYEAAEELANKKELVNSAEYSSISEKEDFAEIKKAIEDGSNTMSFEELRTKIDEMLLAYAKSGDIGKFSATEEDKQIVTKKQFAKPAKIKKSRYGNLFKDNA